MVEAVLARHPQGRNDRVGGQKNRIVIYERLGPDVDILSALLGEVSPRRAATVRKRLQEQLDQVARFSPILRFTLVGPEEREFTAERWSDLGEKGDWIELDEPGKLKELARRLVPKLGTEEFFELF